MNKNQEELYKAINEAQPIQNIGKAEDVAQLVSFLLSDNAKFITGSLHSVDGGYCAQ